MVPYLFAIIDKQQGLVMKFIIISSLFARLSTVASAPTSLMAVQEGLTSIRVSWSPPTPLGHTTGYRIYYYNSGFSSGSVDISGGSTDNYLLTGLLNGAEYTVMIIGTSQHFPSEAVIYKVILGEITTFIHLNTKKWYPTLQVC